MSWPHIQTIRRRLAREYGPALPRRAGTLRVALLYPSPYKIAMSSLGFQTILHGFNTLPDTHCERAFLPENTEKFRRARSPLITYESLNPVADFDLIAISVAYELELPGVLDLLDLAGLPVLASERGPGHPLVLAGGPLTFSNPLPLAPFVDVIIMGEAEIAIGDLVSRLLDGERNKADVLAALSHLPGFYVPSIHRQCTPGILAAPNECLPARSVIMTPETVLKDMFLVEAERGCSRGCTFCVMRRSTNGGMRIVDPPRIFDAIPEQARRVGLVGAAVSDHPKLEEIVRTIVESGRGIGLSSLRADKMTPELVGLFARGGYRQLTVAGDGASERLRTGLERRIREEHLLRCARLAADAKMTALKLYMMIGVPGESEEDIDELIGFSRELSTIIPIILGISPFVAKRNTPLDGAPFESISVIDARLRRLRAGVGRRVSVRDTSARWAWVEYRLAQGGFSMGLAAYHAWRRGGRFGDWKRAIREHGGPIDPPWRQGLAPPPDVLSMPRRDRLRPTRLPSPSLDV